MKKNPKTVSTVFPAPDKLARSDYYVRDYVIWLRFNNGTQGEVDLEKELEGEVFGPLRDVERFKKFRVDPELETIDWENGADLAPEFLHAQIKIPA